MNVSVAVFPSVHIMPKSCSLITSVIQVLLNAANALEGTSQLIVSQIY